MLDQTFDFQDGNGPVPAHQHENGGGWVANSANVWPTAYVGPKALVSGEALVSGKARVSGEARVFGKARVFGEARVSGDIFLAVTKSPVPVIENIDAAILAAVRGGGRLDMGDWHRCKTTH